MTKDERIGLLRSRVVASMASPYKTGDSGPVLQSLDIPNYYKTTIGPMTPEKKAELVAACDILCQSDSEECIKAAFDGSENVGNQKLFCIALPEWQCMADCI